MRITVSEPLFFDRKGGSRQERANRTSQLRGDAARLTAPTPSGGSLRNTLRDPDSFLQIVSKHDCARGMSCVAP